MIIFFFYLKKNIKYQKEQQLLLQQHQEKANEANKICKKNQQLKKETKLLKKKLYDHFDYFPRICQVDANSTCYPVIVLPLPKMFLKDQISLPFNEFIKENRNKTCPNCGGFKYDKKQFIFEFGNKDLSCADFLSKIIEYEKSFNKYKYGLACIVAENLFEKVSNHWKFKQLSEEIKTFMKNNNTLI